MSLRRIRPIRTCARLIFFVRIANGNCICTSVSKGNVQILNDRSTCVLRTLPPPPSLLKIHKFNENKNSKPNKCINSVIETLTCLCLVKCNIILLISLVKCDDDEVGWSAQASHSPFDVCVCNAFLPHVYAWCNAVTSHKNTIIRTSVQITRRCTIECGGGGGCNGARQRVLYTHTHIPNTYGSAKKKEYQKLNIFQYSNTTTWLNFTTEMNRKKMRIKKVKKIPADCMYISRTTPIVQLLNDVLSFFFSLLIFYLMRLFHFGFGDKGEEKRRRIEERAIYMCCWLLLLMHNIVELTQVNLAYTRSANKMNIINYVLYFDINSVDVRNMCIRTLNRHSYACTT